MSQSNDNMPDPVRSVTFVAGNSSASPSGQFIDNPAAKYSLFINPVHPANGDRGPVIAGADAVRADAEARLKRATLWVVAVSFVAANFVVLRTLLQAPDVWTQGNVLVMAMQYGFSLLTSTFVFAVVGSVVLLAGYKVTGMVERLWDRRHG